jgi:sugar O-acyltransferase (sialic acid O-acetyltransferase NeuD family)
MTKPRVLIVGAGGHGQVMLDVIRRQGGAEVVGFLDDRQELAGQEVAGVPVLGPGSDSALVARSGATHFLVAIGDNRVRAAKFRQMQAMGLLPWSAIHPATTLAEDVKLGRGAQVVAGVIVNPAAVIGENVILNTACTVDHHCVLEDHVFIGPGAHLGGAVTVRELAFLGIGALVLPGRTIGAGAMVGAGSVVNKDVPAGVVVVGVPARVVRKLEDCPPQRVGEGEGGLP